MKLRIAALSASSIILVAWPAAVAFAADGDGPDNDYRPPAYCTASADPDTITSGESTTVTVTTTPNTKTTLTISSGSSSTTKTATSDADGDASFPLTLTEVGKYNLKALGEDGAACALSVVVEKVPTTVAGEKTEAETTVLSFTGANTAPYLITAGALAAAGIAVVAVSRRRRES